MTRIVSVWEIYRSAWSLFGHAFGELGWAIYWTFRRNWRSHETTQDETTNKPKAVQTDSWPNTQDQLDDWHHARRVPKVNE